MHSREREQRTRSLDRLGLSTFTVCCGSGGREDDFAGGCPWPKIFGLKDDARGWGGSVLLQSTLPWPQAAHHTEAMAVEGRHRGGETLLGCSRGLQGIDGHEWATLGASGGAVPAGPGFRACVRACNLRGESTGWPG